MKKIIDFCKQKYKILIPIMVVLVLLVTVYFLYREYRYDNYRNKEESKVYQYFGGVKHEYTAIISYNLRKVMVDVKGKEENINYDSTPIYYEDKDKVIFPHEMSIIFPIMDANQYKLFKYTTYEEIDKQDVITSGRDTGVFNNYFLFDGEGLYFFPEEVTLKIDNKDYIKLSANSYAEVIGGYTLTYYDKEKDKSEVIEIDGKEVTAVNDYVDLSLTSRYFKVYKKKILLIPSYNLNSLFD